MTTILTFGAATAGSRATSVIAAGLHGQGLRQSWKGTSVVRIIRHGELNYMLPKPYKMEFLAPGPTFISTVESPVPVSVISGVFEVTSHYWIDTRDLRCIEPLMSVSRRFVDWRVSYRFSCYSLSASEVVSNVRFSEMLHEAKQRGLEYTLATG